MVGTGWGGVADNLVGILRLGFDLSKVCTYVGTGTYFGDSHK